MISLIMCVPALRLGGFRPRPEGRDGRGAHWLPCHFMKAPTAASKGNRKSAVAVAETALKYASMLDRSIRIV